MRSRRTLVGCHHAEKLSQVALRSGSPLLLGLLIACGAPLPRACADLDAGLQPSKTSANPTSVEIAAQEDQLFRSFCRYLKLTRTQVLHLTPFARQASRMRDLLERECNQRQQAIDALAATPSEVSERLRLSMEQRRGQVLADLRSTGARALVRILTREQIALVWRLAQRNPPQYAQADPILLEPQAGFVDFAAGQSGKAGSLPLGEYGSTLLTGKLAVALSQVDVTSIEQKSRVTKRSLEAPVLGNGLLSREGQSGRDAGARPFPQLVAETNDANDLIPALEPVAARLFQSDRWLSTLEELHRTGEGLAGGRRLADPGPMRHLREYRIERGLRDLTGAGPDLEPHGGEIRRGRYLFEPGQGLRIAALGVTNHYDIQLTLLYHGGDHYQKILDFKNGTSDGGLYIYQGHLTFYKLATGGGPQPLVEHRLRIVRDRTTRIVRGYLDLRSIFAFIDLDDEAVFEKGSGALFLDDAITKEEQGAGALRALNVWGPAPPRP